MKAKRLFAILLFVIMMFSVVAVLSSCAGGKDIDTNGMILVIYNGNGGYLGNKAAQVRKLYCVPGSKIPDYPTDYVTNQYTVSSLGLAMHEGYNLLGWYSNADYAPNSKGAYIKLALEEGNGVYELSAEGGYVRKYVASETGDRIFVYMEEAPKAETEEGGEAPAPVSYVFLQNDPEAPEEEQISVEPGFYICNGEETFTEIDDDNLRAAYEKAYAAKVYTESQAKSASGWLICEDLNADMQTLLAGLPRYIYTYAEASAEDKDLDHYALVDGYSAVYGLFVEDENGAYVESEGNFVKYTSGDAQRYSVVDGCVFTNETTAGMQRYNASMEYWDFANKPVTEEDCVWDGEKYVLNLYAHWEKKNTVYFHYNNETEQVDEMTKKLLDDKVTYRGIASGETIGKKEIVPGYAGHTFVAWSKSATELDPWDFENDLFPDGTSELHLYGYYVEGTYTRVFSMSGLAAIANDPAGKYLIVENIDFGGKELNASPFGLSDGQEFAGEILAYGMKIYNFTYSFKGKNNQANDENTKVGAALIPLASGAKVSGLDIEFNVKASGIAKAVGDNLKAYFYVSGLFGTAKDDCEVTDCRIKVKAEAASAKALESEKFTYIFSVGDFAAYGKENVRAKGCEASVDYSGLKGSVEITENFIAASGK
ncbi:MAG: hypothetical protein J5925_05915 [Clostridia bacterium]|nr:hypothetical protein [Clostridia bacterium]MBR5746118.1 hypothetical protein [Clostridia bacterium]